MRKTTPRSDLVGRYERFETEVSTSEALWNVFAQVVRRNTYASSIARQLRKNKSVVSRQLRELAKTGLLIQSGTGVKQSYEVDWNNLTTYWVWWAEGLSDVLPDLRDFFLPQDIPNWLASFYHSPDELKLIGEGSFRKIGNLIEPVIPQLSSIVQRVVEAISDWGDVHTFYDVFMQFSLSLGVGLPDQKYIDAKAVDIPSSRHLIETLYNPKVRTWLRLQVLTYLASSNIVRNYVLRLAGLIKG